MSEVDTDPSDASNWSCEESDIRVEYHPNSGHGVKTFRFEEFTQAAPAISPPQDSEPWLPFKTRADFGFAALTLDAGMSKAQVNSLIKLFNSCIKIGMDSFT